MTYYWTCNTQQQKTTYTGIRYRKKRLIILIILKQEGNKCLNDFVEQLLFNIIYLFIIIKSIYINVINNIESVNKFIFVIFNFFYNYVR